MVYLTRFLWYAKLVFLGVANLFLSFLVVLMKFSYFPVDCRDLIQKCLKVCPSDRPCLEDILQHSWMNCNLDNPDLSCVCPTRRNSLDEHSLDQASTSSQESI